MQHGIEAQGSQRFCLDAAVRPPHGRPSGPLAVASGVRRRCGCAPKSQGMSSRCTRDTRNQLLKPSGSVANLVSRTLGGTRGQIAILGRSDLGMTVLISVVKQMISD